MTRGSIEISLAAEAAADVNTCHVCPCGHPFVCMDYLGYLFVPFVVLAQT